MRKIAMITTAVLGLAFAPDSFAQQNAAPVSGLPPGASVGAVNAQPPAATGVLSTTRVGPATTAAPATVSASAAPMAPSRPRVRRVRRRVAHRSHVAAPVAQ